MRAVWLLAMIAATGCDAGPIEPILESDCPAGALVPIEPGAKVQVLVNAYYLQEEAARSVRRGDAPAHVDETLDKLAALGVTLVRTNGFNDDAAKIGDSTIQIAPGMLDEVALRGLDVVLARAAASGVRLVLPLGNYWDDFGGARRYVEWAGLPSPQSHDARFFTDAGVIALYSAWITTLLGRVSTVDGIRYGDHPAVYAWELLNEPRGNGLDPNGDAMRTWVDTIGATVKALSPGHAVAIGDEGFDTSFAGYDETFWRAAGRSWMFAGGSSFARNVQSPYVDIATVHLYPDGLGLPRPLAQRASARWIAEHVAIARAAGKPVLVEELGLRDDGLVPDLAERRAWMSAMFSCIARSGAAGGGPWQFAYDARTSDPYTFKWLDGTPPEDPRNSYADLVLQAAMSAAL